MRARSAISRVAARRLRRCSPTASAPATPGVTLVLGLGSMACQAVNPERGHSLLFRSGWRTRGHEPSAGEQGRNTVVSEVGHADVSQTAAIRAARSSGGAVG